MTLSPKREQQIRRYADRLRQAPRSDEPRRMLLELLDEVDWLRLPRWRQAIRVFRKLRERKATVPGPAPERTP